MNRLPFTEQINVRLNPQDMLNAWGSNTTEHLPFQTEFPSIVWLLWLDGWDSAPWMVKEVALSYERHNPGWSVVRLDSQNLKQYLDIPYIDNVNIEAPAKSDIVRLFLLAKHGGVWADATMLCFAPLDSWIHESLMPVQFFMYHGRDGGKGPASWFIISSNESYIIQKWKQAAEAYWSGRVKMHNYFWMDELFASLMQTDEHFLTQWHQVPYLYCEAEGQAAMLADKVQGNSVHLKQLLVTNPPYVLKLSHHGFPEEPSESMQMMNGYHAIMQAYRRRPVFHHLIRPH